MDLDRALGSQPAPGAIPALLRLGAGTGAELASADVEQHLAAAFHVGHGVLDGR
jgi:hypothetical protein